MANRVVRLVEVKSRQRLLVQNVQDQTTLCQDLLYDLIDLWKRHYSYAGLVC